MGSGSQELNGTYDMMGNAWEWLESPNSDTNYGAGAARGLRGGSFSFNAGGLVYRKEQMLAAVPAHMGANAVFNAAEVQGDQAPAFPVPGS